MPVLRQYKQQCKPGIRGNLETKGGKVQFHQDPNGFLEVWRQPTKIRDYYIGADVAKGLETGDYSAAPVYDNAYNLCALWHGHLDPDLYADQLALLGRWYNDALLVIEENNHGLTVLTQLKTSYENLYYRTEYDKLTDVEKKELGWWTDKQTKKLAIDNMARLIREKRLGIPSELMVHECLTYVRDASGTTNAQDGCHDDTVMASAIVLYAMETHAVPVQGIPQAEPAPSPDEQPDRYRAVNGVRKHVSEIQDDARRSVRDDPDDDAGWFRRMGW